MLFLMFMSSFFLFLFPSFLDMLVLQMDRNTTAITKQCKKFYLPIAVSIISFMSNLANAAVMPKSSGYNTHIRKF